MRRNRLATFVGAFLAAAALAGDETPHDLSVPERWKADEVVTRTLHESMEIRLSVVDPKGGERPVRSADTKTDAVLVRRCLDVADDGAPRRSLVRFDEWTSNETGLTDFCL